MNIRPIDPRDIQWQIDDPAYRVTFWSERESTSGTPAWAASEFEVTGPGLEAEDVISWAREHGKDAAHTVVYALVDRRDGRPGLIRLTGREPDLEAHPVRVQAPQQPARAKPAE